jgi:hypothetical protein
MDLQQLKLYAINGSTLGVTTFTNGIKNIFIDCNHWLHY